MTIDPIAAARALIAAQPDLLFRCDLCSDECNCHPHHDMSMSGEYILCDGCEDFWNPKGVPNPLKLIATLADALEASRAENQRLREALRDFDKADWFWRDLDPDDSGDSAHEAISMLPDFMVSCVCSSFSGPTRYVFRAPVLDSGSDDTEVLHFATESEAIAAARARAALRSTRGG